MKKEKYTYIYSKLSNYAEIKEYVNNCSDNLKELLESIPVAFGIFKSSPILEKISTKDNEEKTKPIGPLFRSDHVFKKDLIEQAQDNNKRFLLHFERMTKERL